MPDLFFWKDLTKVADSLIVILFETLNNTTFFFIFLPFDVRRKLEMYFKITLHFRKKGQIQLDKNLNLNGKN